MRHVVKKHHHILIVDRDTVTDLWKLPYNGNMDEGVEILSLETVCVENARREWGKVEKELTVRIKGAIYQTGFIERNDDNELELPWGDDDEVEFTEVKGIETVTVVYMPVIVD